MAGQKFERMTDRAVLRRAALHLGRSDRTLSSIIKRVGRLKVSAPKETYYEAIVQSFVYQQIAGSAADAILKKFMALYHGRIPTPKEFLRTPVGKIRGAGISPQKYSYIRDLCERMGDGRLELDGLSKLPDEEIIAILDEVRGIGRWTAEMFLMFSLGRVNVMPVDDLGIQNAVMKAYGLSRRPSRARLTNMSKKWEPYRSVASLYLWRSLDQSK